MSYVNVAVNATSRFALQRCRISAELVGSKHQFVFDGSRTLVMLPTAGMEGSTFEGSPITCDQWKSEGMIPLAYQVNSIDFEIQLGDTIDIPEEMLKLPAKQIGMLGDCARGAVVLREVVCIRKVMGTSHCHHMNGNHLARPAWPRRNPSA